MREPTRNLVLITIPHFNTLLLAIEYLNPPEIYVLTGIKYINEFSTIYHVHVDKTTRVTNALCNIVHLKYAVIFSIFCHRIKFRYVVMYT